MLKGHEIGGNYDHARCLCTARRCALLQQNLPSTSPPDLLGRACSRWTVLAPLLASLRHRVRLESFQMPRSPVQNLKLLPPLRDRLSSLHLRLCFTTPSKCLPEREIVTFLSFSYRRKIRNTKCFCVFSLSWWKYYLACCKNSICLWIGKSWFAEVLSFALFINR